MTITKAEALTANMFHENNAHNSDGSCVRWRRNGRTKVWKTKPNRFEIPVKYGMRGYWHITNLNASEFHLAEDCTNEKKGTW